MPRFETHYEWVAEKTDEDGDIIDTNYTDTLADARAWKGDAEGNLGLVKKRGNEEESEVFRAYAYFDENGYLSDYFEDGSHVPARFLKEAQS
jgi:hypothetical protein